MMNTKVLALVAAAFLAVPAFAVADDYNQPVTEKVVEGHTVFAIIEAVHGDDEIEDNRTDQAAAVAVLVREVEVQRQDRLAEAFKGVLWFNDQYLVNPEGDDINQDVEDYYIEYPCSGSVYAVNEGDPNPLNLLVATGPEDVDDIPGGINTLTYVESYSIVDPNDRTWVIDKFAATVAASGLPNPAISDVTSLTYPVWVVDVQADVDDTGECHPIEDTPGPTGTSYHEPSEAALNGGAQYCYSGVAVPAGGCAEAPVRLYNAVLYFFLGPEDVRIDGEIDHGTQSQDTNGCHDSAYDPAWPCPQGNDDMEGNSHPFNPNHGGNTDETDFGEEHATHTTGSIDLYFSEGDRPLPPGDRNYDRENSQDTVGSAAPFHEHSNPAAP